MVSDAVRLSVGTLTAIPVRAPRTIDRSVGATAMLIAPIAVLPLAATEGVLIWLGSLVSLSPWVSAALAVGFGAWATRGLHLDGLSDTADGLGSSYEKSRALEVMSRGDAGPMGVSALLIVVLVQVAALASWLSSSADAWRSMIAFALLICASRSTLAVACFRAIPSAKPGGLGALVAGSVGPFGASIAAIAAILLAIGAASLTARPWWIGLIAALGMFFVIAYWLQRCTRRLGGITGDVLGSCVEIGLTTLLIVVSVSA